MINFNKNNKKGITLVTLSIAIIIMLIITSTLIYNITTGIKVKDLNNMYQDIAKLKDKIDLYYTNNKTIPILETKYENVNNINSINPNDNDTYYVIDLEALENLNLTFGQDYYTYKTIPSNILTDLYVINERSHSIYYIKGISFDKNIYYTTPTEDTKVELNEILNIELIGTYKNIANIKMYAVDKTNGIKKLTLMVNNEAYKTYEYNSNYMETKIEIQQIELAETESICNFQIEDEAGNIKTSSSITLEQKTVEWITDKEENEIPVPIGFSPITTEDQGTKYTGFVIKNNTDNNEYVWIPVDSTTSYTYDRYAFSKEDWTYLQTKGEYDSTTNSYKIIKQDQPSYYYTEEISTIGSKTELESVTEYGGFYIGRYEVGVTGYSSLSITSDGTTTWTGYSNGTAVVQKGQQVWNYITRDKAREIAESMYSNNNTITSRLCSSYAWDTTLKFIETQNSSYPTSSVGGNYYDATFEYTDIDEIIKTKEQNSIIITPTGQTTPVNNIYDMGGNVWEWTTEVYSDTSYYCTHRGGNGSDNINTIPASYRGSHNPTAADGGGGFRVTLYL